MAFVFLDKLYLLLYSRDSKLIIFDKKKLIKIKKTIKVNGKEKPLFSGVVSLDLSKEKLSWMHSNRGKLASSLRKEGVMIVLHDNRKRRESLALLVIRRGTFAGFTSLHLYLTDTWRRKPDGVKLEIIEDTINLYSSENDLIENLI